MLRRFREEFLSARFRSRNEQPSSRRRRRSHRASATSGTTPFNPQAVLETHAEVQLGTFLKPFQLSGLVDAVHQLTAAGFTTSESLRALDYQGCCVMAFRDDDAERILLASWLEGYGMHHYGDGLVASGCVSPLHLLNMSDDAFVRAGIRAIGHRRQLFRYLREDESLHVRLDQLREQFDKEDRDRRKMDAQDDLQGGNGGSSLTPAQIYAVTGAGRRGAVSGGGGGRGGGNGGRKATGSGSSSKGGAGGRTKGAPSSERVEELPSEPARSLLHFEVILPGGVEREQETEHEIATGEILGARAWTDDLWALPWRTAGNASMTGGAVPGAQAEAHCEASTPRDGIQLVGLDGKVMHVSLW